MDVLRCATRASGPQQTRDDERRSSTEPKRTYLIKSHGGGLSHVKAVDASDTKEKSAISPVISLVHCEKYHRGQVPLLPRWCQFGLWDRLFQAMNNMNTEMNKTIAGFGMPAVLINTLLSGLVLIGAGTLGLSSARRVVAMASYPSLNRQNQEATSLMGQDIRQAS